MGVRVNRATGTGMVSRIVGRDSYPDNGGLILLKFFQDCKARRRWGAEGVNS